MRFVYLLTVCSIHEAVVDMIESLVTWIVDNA